MDIEAEDTQPSEIEDPRDQIARLELRLDELAEVLTRCRKFKLVSQVAMAAGGIWLLAWTVGLTVFDPIAMMAAIAGVTGGIVMYGSNATTSEEVDAEMKNAEARRAALIGSLKLRVVGPQEEATGRDMRNGRDVTSRWDMTSRRGRCFVSTNAEVESLRLMKG